MIDYVIKFLIGGCVLVFASYLSKTKNIFLSGIITTLPILTLLNMMLQIQYLNTQEFHLAQKSGILGAIGLVLFVASCYVLTTWLKPAYAILFAICILFLYFWMYKQVTG
ncbi:MULTISPECIES: GlpM family protein [Brevibacillus]|jgi:uncharacterized membrane protein (GlpM family)|uniref:GlpM family protein n=1 Tax=Brevibacillus TaxID=55080 RepID=UPI001FE365AB|nr:MULTISPECIES: hypothetical protein [Brevibacillus]MED1949967.1 hypothetical protein [Brevibacillus centrosporus]